MTSPPPMRRRSVHEELDAPGPWSPLDPPTLADFEHAEPVRLPSQGARWLLGLAVGVLLALYVGGNPPATVILAAIGALVAVRRVADSALAGAAAGFGSITVVVFALLSGATPEGLPVEVQVIGVVGTVAMLGGLAAMFELARRALRPGTRR